MWTSRRWFIPLGLIVLVAAGLALWLSGGGDAGQGEGGRPTAVVRVEPARTGAFDVEIKALGTVTPLASVTVRSRVDGELVRVHFREGQNVARGQLLAEVDPRPYRASLAQALGERRQTEAQLAQARRELAQHRELARRGFTTQTRLDQQQALVGQYDGAVAAGDGRIADARLRLEFASIRAPIAGRIGLRGIDAGNLVQVGDTTELATITQMQPISVIFTISESQIDAVRAAMRAQGQGGALRVDAWDRGERNLLATGRLTTADNRIDTGSGTLRLRGTFANSDERLFPNQFVNVRLGVRTIPDALTVPAAAVQQGTKGPFVYIVDQEGLARRRDITAGAGDGERMQVLRGVKPGERVVIEGFDRVKDGEKVEVVASSAGAPVGK
ncbi:MAG: efflux RND transporter periplasmic adaptor subunit [Sphingobium sp.]